MMSPSRSATQSDDVISCGSQMGAILDPPSRISGFSQNFRKAPKLKEKQSKQIQELYYELKNKNYGRKSDFSSF